MSPEAVSRQCGSFARHLASATPRSRTVRCGGASRSTPQADKKNRLRMKQLVSRRIIIGKDWDIVVDYFSVDVRDGDVVEGLWNSVALKAPARLTMSRISTRWDSFVATMMTFWIVSRLAFSGRLTAKTYT